MSKKQKIRRVVKRSKAAQTEDNPQANHKIRKAAGHVNCPICPPWKGENKIARKPRHGAKKPKRKDHR